MFEVPDSYASCLSDYRRTGSMFSAVSNDSLDQFCHDKDFGSNLKDFGKNLKYFGTYLLDFSQNFEGFG